jgi:hypothetical protein
MHAHRHLDILAHRQRGEQRAVLEHHAPAPLQLGPFLGVRVEDIGAEDAHRARLRRDEARDGAQKDRFAGAGPADDAEDLAAPHVEVETVVHDVVAKLVADAARLDHDVVGIPAGHTPSSAKKMENRASATMTAKIAATTEREVSRPRELALPSTCIPR